MVVKDATEYHSEGTVPKKNKTKKATRNLLVATVEEEARFSLPAKAKSGKKKHSVEGNSSNPKKKKKKKKKKRKKLDSKLKNGAFVDLYITIQNGSDVESIQEAEKPPKALKKKRKRGLSCERESSPENPSRGQPTERLEANFLVGKRRKRSVLETCGSNEGCVPKRKKKKHKLARSWGASHAEDDYSEKDLPPTVKMVSHEMMLKPTLIQVAVSKGESKRICCLTSAGSRETRNGGSERGTADTTYEQQEENNCKQGCEETAHVSRKRRQVTEQGRKKKKKKKLKEEEVDFLLTPVSQLENRPAISTETLWKSTSEEKTKKTGVIQNSEGDTKGRKKNKTDTNVGNDSPDLLEDDKDVLDQERKAAAVKRAKTKAKKSKKERDPGASLESSSSSFWESSGRQWDITKRKAMKREDSEGDPSSKQAKLKNIAKDREDELQVVAIKKGNCDEAKINMSRRQSLQEEIDRESGKTKKAVKEEAESGHHFGQWSTANFDSTERKTKFLRLLGGFKKGPASTQDSPAKATQVNMALARHGEEKLQQTLQAEFEKALDWKQRRGAGLGFQTAPWKQGRIDKYTSKSVKFED